MRYQNLGLNFTEEEITEFSGLGTLNKLVSCQKCKKMYLVGVGYLEPNHGRNVLVLHNIIELTTHEAEKILEFLSRASLDEKP